MTASDGRRGYAKGPRRSPARLAAERVLREMHKDVAERPCALPCAANGTRGRHTEDCDVGIALDNIRILRRAMKR